MRWAQSDVASINRVGGRGERGARARARRGICAVAITLRLSMVGSPYAHVAGHDISRPFTMKTPPAPASYPPTRALGASMQQVRAHVPSCKEFRKLGRAEIYRGD